jgi:hypothetical protein
MFMKEKTSLQTPFAVVTLTTNSVLLLILSLVGLVTRTKPAANCIANRGIKTRF